MAELPSPPIFRTNVYFAHVPASSACRTGVEICFERRGSYRQNAFYLRTRFPFGLLTKRRCLELEQEIIVYPRLHSTPELLESWSHATTDSEGLEAGIGNDLYRIREHLPSDSARHIDWKATAKSGALMVREFSRENDRRVRIVFDNPSPGQLDEAGYEAAVSIAATLVWYFAQRVGNTSFFAPGVNSTSVYEFLRYLSEAKPAGPSNFLAAIPPSTILTYIVTARIGDALPAHIRHARIVGLSGMGSNPLPDV